MNYYNDEEYERIESEQDLIDDRESEQQERYDDMQDTEDDW